MKRKLSLLNVAAFLGLIAVGLTGCGEGEDNPNPNPSEEGGVYNITLTNDVLFSLSLRGIGLENNKIESGETVYVSVYHVGELDAFDEMFTVDVKANGESITKHSDIAFEFVMPAKDVTLSIEYDLEVREVDETRNMSIRGHNQISRLDPEVTDYDYWANQTYNIYFGTIGITGSISGENSTFVNTRTLVLDQDYKILDDLTVGCRGTSGVTVYNGTVDLDINNLSADTTKLYLLVGEVQRDQCVGMEIDVVNYGEVLKDEAKEIEVEFDFSGVSSTYKDAGMRVFFGDDYNAYIYGSCYESTQFEEVPSEEKPSFTFKYVVGHEFTISAGYKRINQNGVEVYSPLTVNGESQIELAFENEIATYSVTVTDPQ